MSVGQLRHRATDFATAAGASVEVVEAVALAVSETVTNAILHAYPDEEGQVRVGCRFDGERIIVEVADEGGGIASRPRSPGIGHGLATVGALAQSLDISPGPEGQGTVVTMAFGAVVPTRPRRGLEELCGLALETVADVSCLDRVSEGVLRRVAARVADDAELTEWLRAAIPPAKPGTATWAALREGGAQLVVHDPSVPRSPGGTGERLDLAWWLAVPLEEPDGAPATLWGLGGRKGGRPVPSDQVIRVLAEAAHGDLAQAGTRALLRGRLAATSGVAGPPLRDE